MSTWLVQTLAVAAGLAVLAALAGLWSRAGARTRHALWLLVLLKLMMPPLVIVDWPGAPPAPAMDFAPLPEPAILPAPVDLPAPEPTSLPAPVAELHMEPATPPLPALPSPMPEPLPAAEPLAPVAGVLVAEVPFIDVPPESPHLDAPAFVPITPAAEPIRWMDWIVPVLLAAWLIGSLAILARQSYRLLRFQRQLARETRENIFESVPEWLLLELADAGRLLNVAAPRVTRTALIDTPLVWCLGRPRLLLPDVLIDSLGRDAWRGILRHELAHLKRKDHWVARLELLGEIAWWWNPLFWLAWVQIHKYAELCCDAWVIALDSDTPGRHAYAMALLSVCEHLSKPRPTPTLGLALGMGVGESEIPGSRSARTLERRLRMILEEPPARRTSRLALLAILLLGLVVIPIWLHERDRALIREIALLTTSLRPTPSPTLDILSPPATQTMLPETMPVPVQNELVTNAVMKVAEKPQRLPLVEPSEPSPLPMVNSPSIVPPVDPLPEAIEKKAKPQPAEEPQAPKDPGFEPVPNSTAVPAPAKRPMPPEPSSPSPLPEPSPPDLPIPSRRDNEKTRARAAYDKAITLELPEQSLRSTIRALSKETGLTFVLDPRSKESLDQNVQFRGYGRSVEHALDSILDKFHLRATMDENGILLISDRPQPIPLRVQLPEVIEPTSSSDPSGLPDASKPSHLEPIKTPYKRIQILDHSPNTMELLVLRRPVPKTFQVKDQTLTEALKSLSKTVGYEIVPHQAIRDRADSTIVTYQSQGKPLAQELQSLISEHDCWFEVGKEGIIWVQGRTSRESPYSPSERQSPQILRALAQPIDINLNNIPLKQAVEEIQSKSGVNIVLDTRWSGILEKKAYINVTQVKLRSTLILLLNPLGLTFRVTDGVILISKRPETITSEPPTPGQTIAKNPDVPTPDFPGVEMYRKLQTPIDLDIKDLPLDRVMRTIQAQTGVDIIFNPKVKDIESKTVSFQAKGIKLASALNMVLSQHNLIFTADDKRITIAPRSAKSADVASSGVPNPLVLPDPDPDAQPFSPPTPSEPKANEPTEPPAPPSATMPPSPLAEPIPALPVQKPSIPAPSPVRPSLSSPPAAKPDMPRLPDQRSPFEHDAKPPRPKDAEDRPTLPSRQPLFAPDSRTAQPKADVESRELLQIQIRKAKAVQARVTAEKGIAEAKLARYLRLIKRDPNLISHEEMRTAEAELTVADSLIEVEKINVAEAEERLKEFDRRRARDLARLKLSLSYAKKALEIAQVQRNRGIISFDDVRKAEQAVQELELQLKYDFPEEPQQPQPAEPSLKPDRM